MYRFIVTWATGTRVFESDDRDQGYQTADMFMQQRGRWGYTLREEVVPVVREVTPVMQPYGNANTSRAQRRETQQGAQQDGYDMARALAGVFVIRPDVEMSAMVALAAKLANWEGYTDMEVGLRYVAGFQQGIQESSKNTTPPAIE